MYEDTGTNDHDIALTDTKMMIALLAEQPISMPPEAQLVPAGTLRDVRQREGGRNHAGPTMIISMNIIVKIIIKKTEKPSDGNKNNYYHYHYY